MNIHFGNQSQFELFPGTTGDPIENTAPRFIFSRIVLTFENVVVIFVFVLVSLIIAFSLGVERGRVKGRIARPAAQSVTASSMVSVMPNPQISVPVSTSRPVLPLSRPVAVTSGIAEAAPAPVGHPVGHPVGQPLPQTVVIRPSPQPAVLPRPAAQSVAAGASEKGVDKGYTVQVASYKSESMAQKEINDLKRQGLEGFFLNKGNYVIVCIGRFSGSDEAKQMQNKLKKRYKDSIVRSF